MTGAIADVDGLAERIAVLVADAHLAFVRRVRWTLFPAVGTLSMASRSMRRT
jgi:hypothetical protein